ncbi:MAG: deoxyguanosinetriphosphate triphosphohydrolase [Gammaproteobacteria bacterium RIFCSPLOWO2_02_FULL_47_50]|nr:MAG: deoxyguanosinetriphosphate triphosphohydrolase [Gammaproteobacteria bacterium RIFCSPLOWO2_01_FULL_47_190]OGT76269.1 MAG: deoxyguanosinetriphosphate triphosphohydrolase [Gammaproteobacteria bacterium RIFCSPLOWO2_12_47_11]OGT79702.1 MAG: deoxyguanosinetriphosphate triphosphohydrolase [Gammaproteobacteria bacterium RIFCSPLOWO2_02_FULL_47_50]OGT87760.1 MAG: deoxyguanosinetriphosphate triphosphohydrolase [Gammaproteobacteria bacterium RIFCSPLOWO2_12_FULL_47_76]
MSELACYAAREDNSKGRIFGEPQPEHRNQYQRDRDRIIHSAAFRRLEYKTQVFVNHEGDMFRTRLTHSIEVAQIGRTIARALKLNEDLTEAICLAHDLGHTPFGHAGQDVLNNCMKDYGGFEHNLQSLRVVDLLEERYADFPGLNLLFETREGILKHCSRKHAVKLGDLGRRFLEGGQPGLEAQVANIADEIAYNNHDVDDGLRSGLIATEQLKVCELFSDQYDIVSRQWPDLSERRLIHEIVRRMINTLVGDLIANSRTKIDQYQPADIDTVRSLPVPLIGLGEEILNKHMELKRFLRKNLYQHDRVQQMTGKAKQTVKTLFEVYMADTGLFPKDVQLRLNKEEDIAGASGRARVIADYIAGMTDRFAIAELERIN